MTAKEKTKRYIIFLIGLFINSFGVSFITKANLGTSPISSIPYTLSLGYPLTLGQFTFIFNLLLVIAQIIILRKNFKKEYYLQIPVTLLFSAFIDFTMDMLYFMNPSQYIYKLISLIAGCIILGFGVFIEVLANVVMLPGESFVNAVSKTFNRDFGKTKIAFDSSMTIIAGVTGLILYHKLAGVREGTVVAAVLVGMIARMFKRKLGFLEEKYIVAAGNTADTRVIEDSIISDSNNDSTNGLSDVLQENDSSAHEKKHSNLVITIGREYGSGGRKIGRRIAEELKMKFYDNNIIKMAAEEMHMEEKKVEAEEQQLTNSLIYDMVAQFYSSLEEKTPQDKLYETESSLIKKIAKEGNCVIVGRCADYICRDIKDTINVFLYADDEHKINEIMKRESLSHDEAEKHVKEINKRRFNHYKYYTGGIWGMASNYDLCIDTGRVGEGKAIELIKEII